MLGGKEGKGGERWKKTVCVAAQAFALFFFLLPSAAERKGTREQQTVDSLVDLTGTHVTGQDVAKSPKTEAQ